jgi:hypothetical protein
MFGNDLIEPSMCTAGFVAPNQNSLHASDLQSSREVQNFVAQYEMIENSY